MSNSDAEAKGLAIAKAFHDAFNAKDYESLAETLNYPHVRLANARFFTFESSEQFIEYCQNGITRLADEGWHHTVASDRHVIQSSDTKVHIAIHNDRCRENGSVYLRFDTFWIATLQDGHWGIKFRSSFLR